MSVDLREVMQREDGEGCAVCEAEVTYGAMRYPTQSCKLYIPEVESHRRSNRLGFTCAIDVGNTMPYV